MSKFCCKHCGMITDNPEIVPHPDKDKFYREREKERDNLFCAMGNEDDLRLLYINSLRATHIDNMLRLKYNHSITCPICLDEPRFWREEPFPTDTDINLSTIPKRVI